MQWYKLQPYFRAEISSTKYNAHHQMLEWFFKNFFKTFFKTQNISEYFPARLLLSSGSFDSAFA